MTRPNIYKARVGLMDVTFKELAYIMRKGGMTVNDSEISVAIHGGRQEKHKKIRIELCRIYDEWKKEVLKTYSGDFADIL